MIARDTALLPTRTLTQACACALLALASGTPHAMAQLVAVDGARPAQGQPLPDQKPGPRPLSLEHGVKLDFIPGVELPRVDNDAVYQQDLANEAAGLGNGVKRMSIERPVAFDWNAGAWYDVPTPQGVGKLWVLDIVSPGAWGVRVHVSNMDLPPGAQMTVYAPEDLAGAPWPYEGRGRRGTGNFWARTAFGDTARVEVYLPPDAQVELESPLFTIDKVHHWYINMRTGTPSAFQENLLTCHNDVTCQSWGNEAAGVCLIYMNGGSCSASLLNTFASDWTPYMYTAAHCFNTQAGADTLETYWFYQTSTCNGTSPALPSGINRADDATLVSTGGTADHTLVIIEGAIRRDLWWQGWDANAFGNGNTTFGIHHPDGSWKRWSTGSTSATGVGCNIAGIGAGVTGTWSSGTTEPGSSGSPLFDSARRVRGALSCANATCTGSRRFYYGPFSVAYPAMQTLLNGGNDDIFDFFSLGDTCAGAADLGGVGSNSYTSLVAKSVDEDWYKYTVPAGGTLTVNLGFVHAWGDIDTTLYEGCGGGSGGTFLTGSGGTGNSESFTWTNTAAFARTVSQRVYLFNDTRNQYNMSYSVTGAPSPTNDLCANAIFISDGQTINGSTLGAATEGSSSCGFNNANDIWYTFFSTCEGPVTVSTFGSNFDTVLSVHTGCPGTTANEVPGACNDDFAAPQRWSQLTFNAAANTTYTIRVVGYNALSGLTSLTLSRSRPFNDSCSSPIPLFAGSYGFNNCGTTTDGPVENLCGGFAGTVFFNDFWNTWVAPSNGTATVDTVGTTGVDTMLAAYAGSCPGGPNTAIACNDDFAPPQRWSRIDFPVSAGETYYIRTGGYNGAAGPGQLNIAFTPSGPVCDSLDFNNDGIENDPTDIEAFLSVYSGGPCIPVSAVCNDIDFNNDGIENDPTDLEAFLSVYSGGVCF